MSLSAREKMVSHREGIRSRVWLGGHLDGRSAASEGGGRSLLWLDVRTVNMYVKLILTYSTVSILTPACCVDVIVTGTT